MQPGQLVVVSGLVENAPLARDIARAAYEAGASLYNTLFDENATCHIAYGAGFAFCVDDDADREAGLNISKAHTDFMVGGPDVEIDGQARGRAWTPIIRGDEFQIH